MDKQIKIFFAGDFCSKPSTSKITVSDELMSLIQSCDLKVVNFEVPLKPDVVLPTRKRERFFQNDDAPDFLRGMGFNLFSLANNHAFDWGEDGFLKTKAALGDQSFGSGTYDEAYNVKVCEVDGRKIGFLAMSFAAYAGVFDDVAKYDGLGCAYVNDRRVCHDIYEAKKNLDYLFVLPHDGIEYIDIPMPDTIARYRDFVDWGADGVIATHPHCPQGWEEYKGKPIFYSLGNFLFNSKETYDFRANKPHWYEGICVMMTMENGNISWEVVNICNVNNLGIAIDHNENRIKHNESICLYLKDKVKYDIYLSKICNGLGRKELSIIDMTFHPHSLKSCTKQLLHCWMNKIKGKNFTNNNQLLRLLTHDASRDLLMQTLKQNY